MKKVTILSLFLTLSSVFLVADETATEQFPLNSSPLTPENQALVEQIEKQKEENEATALAKFSQYLQVSQEALAYIDMQTFADHVIYGFPQENMLRLDDGSDWTVDQSDVRELRKWKLGHIVLLYPRKGDTNKPFMFYNQSINSTLKVNPYAGPTVNGLKTNLIIGLDPRLGHIYLRNGGNERSSWAIDKSYWPLFQEWGNGHPIIIANYNKSWLEKYFPHFFPSYDFVLFNITKVCIIPVKPL